MNQRVEARHTRRAAPPRARGAEDATVYEMSRRLIICDHRSAGHECATVLDPTSLRVVVLQLTELRALLLVDGSRTAGEIAESLDGVEGAAAILARLAEQGILRALPSTAEILVRMEWEPLPIAATPRGESEPPPSPFVPRTDLRPRSPRRERGDSESSAFEDGPARTRSGLFRLIDEAAAALLDEE